MTSSSSCLLVLVLSSLFTTFVLANKKPYIVYLGGHSHGRDSTPADHEFATTSHHELLGSFLGSESKAREAIFSSYTKYINGFAASLEEEEASQLSKHPGVVSVFPDKVVPLHTTRSWRFLSLEKEDGSVPPSSTWRKARYGEDVIIANIDTGVWPESQSFNDAGMGPVPARWRGACQDFSLDGVPCNKKLIGAKFYNKGYISNETYYSTRDVEGHGTHTLSTAGGGFVKDASTYGFANGTAKGGSPAARVAAYKVCSTQGCSFSNIMSAIDDAIYDGVDVLSISLGGGPDVPYVEDGLAISSFHAVKEGVVVVASAGNSGPTASTVSNTAPWIFTVAASSMDRDYPTDVFLGDVNLKKYTTCGGVSLTSESLPEYKSYPLISSDQAAISGNENMGKYCMNGTIDPDKVRGRIIVCLRGLNGRIEKGLVVREAGAVGMILINSELEGEEIALDSHFLPAAHLTQKRGELVYSYISKTESPMAYIGGSRTRVNVRPAPVIVDFSSRGPNYLNAEILKPDITAPGKWVLAAFPSNISPTGLQMDTRFVNYTLMSGTSMSCPHVAGITGLLRSRYPHWSPAMIRSAIMTTATTRDNAGKNMRVENLESEATPFDYGAGHVQPNKATDPGLVYELTTQDYLNFLCYNNLTSKQIALVSDIHNYSCPAESTTVGSIRNMNYPSITVLGLTNTTEVTAKRTLKNVGDAGEYRVRLHHPRGVHVTVKPNHLRFQRFGEEKMFELTFSLVGNCDVQNKEEYVFGEIVWTDGTHHVRSPLVVQFRA